MSYTLLAVLAVVAAAALDLLVFGTKLLLHKGFWVAYAIVLFFQLIVNGLLTGLPVVRYDPREILGWRIFHEPVEDVLFGFAMVTVTLTLWVWLGRRAPQTAAAHDEPPATRAARR
ncbi:MAG: lycopene cyclase domain-containing protein [Jatrophihabitans sp.]|nr:MAG: lycopene cyclase domain-containing protein [Jatrophihabitans sp.]